MVPRSNAAWALAWAAMLVVHTQGQVFRARIDTVRTEVAVIDNRTGRPVLDLVESDFTISENGRPQTISIFARDFAPAAMQSEADDSTQTKGNRRAFVLIFGLGRLLGPVQAHEGAVEFVRTRLRPDDLVAVMAWNRVTALTADRELIATVIERIQRPSKEVWDAMSDDIARHDQTANRPSPATQAVMDAWLTPPGAPDSWLRSSVALLVGAEEYRRNPTWVRWGNAMIGRDVLKVAAAIEYLRPIDGDKHVVLFSEFGFTLPIRFQNEGVGMRLDSREDDMRFAARANDARVAIDIILTRGTDRFVPSTISSAHVAEESGGQFTSLRAAADQLARIDDASRNHYILGYVPANRTLDGKYRSVTVSVKRRDVTLVYRRGYTASADPPPIDARDLLIRTRLREGAASDTPLEDVKVRLEARPQATAGTRQVRVALHIDPTSVSLSLRGGRWVGVIDLLVLIGDARQTVVGRLEQQMTVSVTPALLEQARATGIPYEAVIPVSGVPARAKAVVYEFDTDRLGTAYTVVK